MNGNRLLDSNILIYLSKKILSLDKICDEHKLLFISIITYMEVMGFHFNNPEEKQFMSLLCEYLNIINLEDDIVKRVIILKQKKKIKLPDAIIAATAIEKKLVLVTQNTEDFKNIHGLQIFNPF